MSPSLLLGFDPGKDKCGLAIVRLPQQIIYHQVIAAGDAMTTVVSLARAYPLETIVMGDRTTAKSWKSQLETAVPQIPLVLVNEAYSSLQARDRYWQMFPPKGLMRLVPSRMRLPPRPIDDIVAIILIERYQQQQFDVAGEKYHS
ncbi:resolvase [Geitlerinema sp. PCC 9228]|jgi:RNase H-fold protein (predicted Holliday junction resolvase)|uniref:resolvase n=1 Tax=Geitlerinema sp. PCC 9228 TaxID=111611 RepID=UPI0008F98776|nr:resolvase [Geitlerinema sp. PCC 9228]